MQTGCRIGSRFARRENKQHSGSFRAVAVIFWGAAAKPGVDFFATHGEKLIRNLVQIEACHSAGLPGAKIEKR